MRIVIDLQGAQTESRYRGIGRYSLSLALAIARNAGEHEIWLALNGAFPESIVDIRHTFDGLIPQDRIRVFEVPLPVAERDSGNEWHVRAAELIREYFLQQLNPDMVLVTSLFEGYIDDAVTSVGKFSSGYDTAVILYDLIPYLNQERYLPEQKQRDYYSAKINSLKNAGLLLSISESSRLEGIKALGIPENRIVNISTASDESFHSIDLAEEQIQKLRHHFGISRKMVMYAPGGFDERKNFDGLIKAYGMLPKVLRAEHQLVVVSKIQEADRKSLERVAKQTGLEKDELVLTGYVPDEDLIALYNIATLFVFPSKHEGFGLPALEAMACGTPVIGSNTTSVPEVIGWDEALFDPASPESIALKMQQVLENETWREQLVEREKKQAQTFSWNASAQKAIAGLERLFVESRQKHHIQMLPNVTKKPKLAYFSPLPPVKSGISDYSADLLPFLEKYYDITLIVDQKEVSDSLFEKNFPVKTPQWFLSNAQVFDRTVYQFGNSPFHSYMLPILKQVPGVIVLHDFFMSGMLAYEEFVNGKEGWWTEALFRSHGYWALKEYLGENGVEAAKIKYPCNLELMQNAHGIIVHSDYSKQLADEWYGHNSIEKWSIIPLLRVAARNVSKDAARQSLGLDEKDFVVCSFGFVDPTKLNHRLLDAWSASKLAHNPNCKLIFVGENHGGEYGLELLSKIKNSGLSKNVHFTGWTDTEMFRKYLEAADVGVQLRTLSRGETSAAVLDCMNYGLAAIVNANGSMASLPHDAVHMLPDEFADAELVNALEKLENDTDYRFRLGENAKETIQTRHDPAACARQYAETIEAFYFNETTDYDTLIESIAEMKELPKGESELSFIAQSIAATDLPDIRQKQLFVDVSAIVRTDLKTGIERVVRAQLLELIKAPPKGYRVEPVYLTEENGWQYRYARQYMCSILDIALPLIDEPVDIFCGDVFYGLDYYPDGIVKASQSGLFTKWKAHGVAINFAVYDLLPVLNPEFFPKGADKPHLQWLETITGISDQLVCISNAVADDLRTWVSTKSIDKEMRMGPNITAVHLGADVCASIPSKGLPSNAASVLAKLKNKLNFLMVGTIEPRKGHLQVLDAFEVLWGNGSEVNLVIVGKEGWTSLPDSERRTIPKIVSKLRNHPELNKRLFLLGGISDEYLEKIYEASTCLLAASEGEGFGLPLIEAAQHKLPIIARDLPVFREVAGEYAYYFENDSNPSVIEDVVKKWLELYKTGSHPKSDDMTWLTWEQSAQQLVGKILKKTINVLMLQ